jgi:hypothetical protein
MASNGIAVVDARRSNRYYSRAVVASSSRTYQPFTGTCHQHCFIYATMGGRWREGDHAHPLTTTVLHIGTCPGALSCCRHTNAGPGSLRAFNAGHGGLLWCIAHGDKLDGPCLDTIIRLVAAVSWKCGCTPYRIASESSSLKRRRALHIHRASSSSTKRQATT